MRGQGAAARGSGLGVGWPSLPQPPLGRAPSRRPHSCSWRPRGTSRGPRLRPDLAEVDEPFALPGLTTTSDTSGTMLHCIRQPLANRRQRAPLKQHRLQAAGSQDHVRLRQCSQRRGVERPAAWVDRPSEAPAVASKTTRATHGCGRLRSPQRPWGPPGGRRGSRHPWAGARRPPRQYFNALFSIKNLFRSTSLRRQREALGKRVCKSALCVTAWTDLRVSRSVK